MPIVVEYIAILEIDFHDHIPDFLLDVRRHGVDEFEQYADGNQICPGVFVFDLEDGFRINSLFAVKAFEIVFDDVKKRKMARMRSGRAGQSSKLYTASEGSPYFSVALS